jgi:cytochrome c oxidase subunit 3
MGIKSIEYGEKFSHHLAPGPNFQFHLNDPHASHPLTTVQQEVILKKDPFVERHAQMFYVMYFCLTGLHGFHVVCGIGVLIWMLLRASRGEFNSQWNTPVELTGLYWHLVDLVWIFLFPVIYLAHRNG